MKRASAMNVADRPPSPLQHTTDCRRRHAAGNNFCAPRMGAELRNVRLAYNPNNGPPREQNRDNLL
jgi:hypothetical protein